MGLDPTMHLAKVECCTLLSQQRHTLPPAAACYKPPLALERPACHPVRSTGCVQARDCNSRFCLISCPLPFSNQLAGRKRPPSSQPRQQARPHDPAKQPTLAASGSVRRRHKDTVVNKVLRDPRTDPCSPLPALPCCHPAGDKMHTRMHTAVDTNRQCRRMPATNLSRGAVWQAAGTLLLRLKVVCLDLWRIHRWRWLEGSRRMRHRRCRRRG